MGVFDGTAYEYEEFESCARRQLALVAILRDGYSWHVLHHEVRAAIISDTSAIDLRDVGMAHHREGLALTLEASDDLARVHAELDDFEGDPPAKRLFLLCQIHNAHTTLAERLENSIRTDALAEVCRGHNRDPALAQRAKDFVRAFRCAQPELHQAARTLLR